ncbi:hypothetical protein GCM10018966_042750 [Streptomyces yanii]
MTARTAGTSAGAARRISSDVSAFMEARYEDPGHDLRVGPSCTYGEDRIAAPDRGGVLLGRTP